MNVSKALRNSLLFAGLFLTVLTGAWGNNVTVDTVMLGPKDVANDKQVLFVKFKWDNSWNHPAGNGLPASRDAVWLFVKYRKAGTATWHHAFLAEVTSNSSDFSVGTPLSGSANQYTIEGGLLTPGSNYNTTTNPTVGIFFYKNTVATNRTTFEQVGSNNLKLTWNYSANSDPNKGGRTIGDNDAFEIKVYAVEMVYIPTGDFRVGNKDSRNALLSSTGTPMLINTSSASGSQSLRRTQSTGFWSSGSSVSASITIDTANCPNSILIASVAYRNDLSTRTWSQGLTKIGWEDKGKQELEIAYRYNPSPGTQTHSITFNGAPDGAILTLAQYCNIHQPNPAVAPLILAQNGVTSNPVSISVPTTIGDRVFGIMSLKHTTGQSITMNGDSIFKSQSTLGNTWSGIQDIVATSSSTTMTWTNGSGQETAYMLIDLTPASNLDASIVSGLTVDGDGGIISPSPGNAAFPTGYKAFYCMKYEVSQAMYVAFLNTLTEAQQEARTQNPPTDPAGTAALCLNGNNSDRNGIDILTPAYPFPAKYHNNLTPSDTSQSGAHIACNYLMWGDLSAWLDWSGLRPMTELEYEKAARSASNQPWVYPWGSSTPEPMTNYNSHLANPGTSSEAPAPGTNYNVNAGGAIGGPVRVGAFARSSNGSRGKTGVAISGVQELAGNVWEMVVSTGSSTGRAFAGNHGNGYPDDSDSAWPAFQFNGTEYPGIGSRGGGWDTVDFQNLLEVSDRTKVNWVPSSRTDAAAHGGRGVRTTLN